MSESEKKKPAVIKKWTPDEVRQLYQGNSDQTKCVPYVKLRADDAFPCANIVHQVFSPVTYTTQNTIHKFG